MTNIILNTPATTNPQLFSSQDLAALAVKQVLPNVDNTSDVNKPVSIAQQAALDLKANLVSPSLVTPALGTPSSGVLTNCTGTAAGLTAGNVTTNANLTGDITSVGNATTLTNAPVIAKVLTGYVSGSGTVSATDSILSAIQKVDGNDALKEVLTNKSTSVATDQASNTKYPSVKAVYDWATGLFQTLSAKDASGGYAGLTLYGLNLKNAANTFTNYLTNATTASRTWTMPDKDGTVAMLSDVVLSGAEVAANKDASGGYAGLTLFKINFKNAANTFTSFLTNVNTAARTYTFPDKDLIVAGLVDLTATNTANTPAGNIAATTVQAAINELDTEKLAISRILGTVSQSAGVPTGALIEKGSNANGDYVRYADGTQICWFNSGNISVITPGTYYSASGSFPATFSSTPKCIGSIQSYGVGPTSSFFRIGAASASAWTVTGTTNISDTVSLNITATGRWF